MDTAPVADRTDPVPPTADPSAAGRCPFPHAATAPAAPAAPPAATRVGAAEPVVAEVAPESRTGWCPIPASVAPALAGAGGCPVAHGPTDRIGPGGVPRSPADVVVRRLLRIRERPAGVTNASAYSAFQKSMLISATRCTLTYVIFPFVLPMLSFARGVGPVVGVTVGSIAMVCDVFTIRRFFAVDHKWRWHFSAIALSVMSLLAVLWVQDVSHIVGHLTS